MEMVKESFFEFDQLGDVECGVEEKEEGAGASSRSQGADCLSVEVLG